MSGDLGRRRFAQEFFLADTSELLRAGLDLSRVLEMQEGSKGLRAQYAAALSRRVEAGEEVSAVFRDLGFVPVVEGLVRTGEATGDLGMAFARASAFLERSRLRRERWIRLFSYPAGLTALSTMVGYVIAAWVVPSFSRMYGALHLEASPVSRGISELSRAVVSAAPYFTAGLAAVAAGLYLARGSFAQGLVRRLLRFPFLGSPLRIAKAREGAEVLSLLLGGGIDLLEAVGIMAELDVARLGDIWRRLSDDILSGVALSVALLGYPEFPVEFPAMMALAEQTGDLSGGAERLHGYLERRLERILDRLARAAEPAGIVFLGLMVGGSTLLLVLPMMDLVRRLS